MAPSVLVVEDSSPARQNIAMFLDPAGYQVAQADTGEDALRLLEASGHFDVVVKRLAHARNLQWSLSFQNRIAPQARF